MIKLHKIPYVTNLPDDGQLKIIWIKNGELLVGASTKHGHEGVLNMAGVQIQENVEVLEVNIKNVAEVLDSTNDTVAKLEELIAITGNLDLVEQVKTNTADIKTLSDTQIEIKDQLDLTSSETDKVIEDLGSRTISSGTRTVFDDLVYVKSVVGQEKDHDINGNSTPGAESSGLTRKIEDVTKQTIKNTNELAIVSAIVESADLPELIANDAQIRKELGPTPITDVNIYLRLNGLETKCESSEESIVQISESIGLGTRVVVNELDALAEQTTTTDAELNTPITGAIPRITTLELVVLDKDTGLVKQVDDIKDDISSIEKKIGTDGIPKDIKNLSEFVGYGTEPAPKTSLAGKLETLTALQNDTAASVQDLQVELGNTNSGVIGDIKKINEKLVAQDVLIKDFGTRIKSLEDRVAILESA